MGLAERVLPEGGLCQGRKRIPAEALAILEPVPEVLFSPFVAAFVAAFVERIARFIGSSTKFATKMRILKGLG